MKPSTRGSLFFALLITAALACNAPGKNSPVVETPTVDQASVIEEAAPSANLVHTVTPSEAVAVGKIVFDVESSGTGVEQRAPYGDSYDFNFLERPFTQDMTYLPDVDIFSYAFSTDDNFHYASIKLVGFDPNNPIGIHYGVEIDTNKDGYGDFIVLVKPPFTAAWSAETVQVFEDQNHNTSSLSPIRSDAPSSTDGYESLLFDGSTGTWSDPDLAWVRMVNAEEVTLQIAFKRTLAGDSFLAGVIADAGIKDVSQMDYVDRFTEAEAGSSVRDKETYPLKALFSVDNTCRDAFGFKPTGYEPMICVGYAAPVSKGPGAAGSGQPGGSSQSPQSPSNEVCSIQPSDCTADAPFYYGYPSCACSATPYYENQ